MGAGGGGGGSKKGPVSLWLSSSSNSSKGLCVQPTLLVGALCCLAQTNYAVGTPVQTRTQVLGIRRHTAHEFW